MRILKFRAWANKKMYNELAYITMSGKAMSQNPDTPLINPTIMQWTGLKDKNEIEIFEGDIVIYSVGDIMMVAEIKYEPEMGAYIAEWAWSKNQHHVSLTCDSTLEMVVVGNVYQNPEIFK